jgi:hypothetical protein
MKIPDLQTGFQILSRLPLANSRRPDAKSTISSTACCSRHRPGEVYLQLLEQTRISLCFIEEELARRYTTRRCRSEKSKQGFPGGRCHLAEGSPRLLALCAVAGTRRQHVHAERAGPDPAPLHLLHRNGDHRALSRPPGTAGRTVAEPARVLRQRRRMGHGDHPGAGFARFPWPQARTALPLIVSLLLPTWPVPTACRCRDIGLVGAGQTLVALVSLQPVLADEPLPPFVVDLMQDCGLRTSNECLHTPRTCVASTPLAWRCRSIRREKQLQQRIPPSTARPRRRLHCGKCHHLLNRLYRPWCMLRAVRANSAATMRGKVLEGLLRASRHALPHLGQGVPATGERQHLFTPGLRPLFAFRHMLDPTQMLEVRQVQLGFGGHTWEVLDQCAKRLSPAANGRRQKIEPGQLLSICPHDGKSHLLAQVAWLMQEQRAAADRRRRRAARQTTGRGSPPPGPKPG